MTKSSSIQNMVAPNILKDQSHTGTGQQQWRTTTSMLQRATITLQTVHPIHQCCQHRKDYCYYGDIIRYASAVAKTPRIYWKHQTIILLMTGNQRFWQTNIFYHLFFMLKICHFISQNSKCSLSQTLHMASLPQFPSQYAFPWQSHVIEFRAKITSI